MPKPGSHRFDIRRTRLRDEYDDRGIPDQHADDAARERMERTYPPGTQGDPDRQAGPRGVRGTSRGDPGIEEPPRPVAAGLEVRSAAFSEGTLIPDRYSYEGGNVSPPLEWTHLPDDTEELAVLCDDPDAPGGTFTHWVVSGITPQHAGLPENGLPPDAIAGRNDFGGLGWGGPRPPVGDDPHHYVFRVFAVDRPLGLGEGSGPEDLHAALDGHVLARGQLVGLFAR